MSGGDENSKKSSSFTIISNDHPGILITHVILKGQNYEEWSKAVQISLRAKNKLGFINGTETEPPATSDNYEAWWSTNAMIVAWILNTIEEKLRSTISYRDVAKELWDDIKQRFSVRNGTQIYQLRADLIACRQQPEETIMAYYGRMKKIWDSLSDFDALPSCQCHGCKCDIARKLVAHRDEERVLEFLMGLDPCYSTVRSNILSLDPLPNLNQVYSKLIQEENVHAFTHSYADSRPEPMAFAARV